MALPDGILQVPVQIPGHLIAAFEEHFLPDLLHVLGIVHQDDLEVGIHAVQHKAVPLKELVLFVVIHRGEVGICKKIGLVEGRIFIRMVRFCPGNAILCDTGNRDHLLDRFRDLHQRLTQSFVILHRFQFVSPPFSSG